LKISFLHVAIGVAMACLVSVQASAAGAGSAKVPPASRAQAPGGSDDKVWVNTSSKNYHCPGAVFYGKTRVGKYMPEKTAKSKGYRGKACGVTAVAKK
jgi:hypothetical protein